MWQALISALGQAEKRVEGWEPWNPVWEAAVRDIILSTLRSQVRGTAGGLFNVLEWLQPGMLEGCGAEGLLPWLLGVRVLRYGGGYCLDLPTPVPAPSTPPSHLVHL
jgi:hypothetical protein